VPPSTASSDADTQVASALEQLRKDADKRAEPTPNTQRNPKSVASKGASPSGTGNQKGKNGMNGPGGIGTGRKPGPGTGGDPGGTGRKATDAEIKAWRWRFDLSGDPKTHADKLEKAGVIVAIPDPKAGNMDPNKAPLLVISDLKRRPVAVRPAAADEFADAVKWFNRRPESVQGLAQELRLQQLNMPTPPPYIVLLLPKDREAKMATEEERYAKRNGMPIAAVQETFFDFRLQNGVYEPVVTGQR